MRKIQCQINALKFNGEIYRTWKAELIDQTFDYWLFVGVFENEITHGELGVIRRNTISYEYYWKNRWFNIFRFLEPDGTFRNFYCNINMPPIFTDHTLSYVDLDIDLLVEKDLSYRILDLADFKKHSEIYNYSPQIKKNVENSITNLKKMIETRQFPFDDLHKRD